MNYCLNCGKQIKKDKERAENIIIARYVLVLLLFIVIIFSITTLMNDEKSFEGSRIINGAGEKHIELNCREPESSKWTITVTAILTNTSMKEDKIDWIMVGITHYEGGRWRPYEHNVIHSEGSYANVILKKIQLNPSETYRIAVDTDPDELEWHLNVTEKWWR